MFPTAIVTIIIGVLLALYNYGNDSEKQTAFWLGYALAGLVTMINAYVLGYL